MTTTRLQKSDFLRLRPRPWGLITAAGIVAGVATVMGFCGRAGWFFDLFSHFRVQYFLGLTVVSLLLTIPRQHKAAACFAALAAVNLGVVLPIYIAPAATNEARGEPLRAMLLNVNTHSGDPLRVAEAIRAADPDILVLEEISSRWVEDLKAATTPYPYSTIRPRSDNFGIGLFSKLPFERSEVVFIGNAGVPSIISTMRSATGALTVVATHPLPPAGGRYTAARNEQLASLPAYVARSRSPLLLLGDLNVTPWNRHFKQLLRDGGLIDSAKGRGVQTSWPAGNPLLRIPLDHCLHSPEITILDRDIGPDVGSDHLPLVVDFAPR